MTEIQPIETAKEIGQKALKGGKWVFLSTILSKSFQFLTTIILARLLLPADFGIIAIAQIITGVVSLFQDMGMTQALIQKKEDIEGSADTVFLFNIFWSLILYIAVFIAAPYISAFFKNNEAAAVLRVLCLSFLFLPFNIISNAFIKKGFHFKRLFNITIWPIMLSSLVSIFLAYLGFGVWALVFGILTGNLLNTILGWLSISWRPSFKFNMTIARDMLNFGGAISIQNVIIWFENTFDDILVGRWLGTPLLGVYRMGYNIAIIPASQIAGPINDVVYSTFVRIQDNKAELKRFFLYIIKYISLITFPIGAFLITSADIFITTVLGEKWSEAVPVIQFVSVYGTIGSITFVIPTLTRALGRHDVYLRYLIVFLFVMTPIYIYAVPYGIKAISAVHLLLGVIFLPYIFNIGMGLLNIKLSEIINSLWVSVVISIAIGVAIYCFTIFFPPATFLSQTTNIFFILLFSILLYIVLLYLISRNTFSEIIRFAIIATKGEEK